jgi:sugar O-acyltransferase (sialic acid O-acetyltransferase NeuD family)
MAEERTLIVIGAGGHGQVVADAARLAGYQVVGYLDDASAKQDCCVGDLPVLGRVSDWQRFIPAALVVAIGDNRTRARVYEMLAVAGAAFGVPVHPRAWLAPGVSLGRGSVAFAGAIVNTGAAIGNDVILNTACSVDHHNVLGDHVHIAPGAHLAGEVSVGAGTLVGIGATVLPGIQIGRWATVGAGAVVTADVPDGAAVVGVPARLVRKIL